MFSGGIEREHQPGIVYERIGDINLFLVQGEGLFSVLFVFLFLIYVAFRDLVPFVQFKNLKNTHGGVLLLVKL